MGGEDFADGCDAVHRDANDDGKCDTGGEDFDDGCDAVHRDANDDGKCDAGGEDFDDGREGLGAGAIAGLAAGSVLVLGLGGFSLFWFVIKKKGFNDLLGIFKK